MTAAICVVNTQAVQGYHKKTREQEPLQAFVDSKQLCRSRSALMYVSKRADKRIDIGLAVQHSQHVGISPWSIYPYLRQYDSRVLIATLALLAIKRVPTPSRPPSGVVVRNLDSVDYIMGERRCVMSSGNPQPYAVSRARRRCSNSGA